MTLEFTELNETQRREVIDLIQRKWAVEAMLAEIQRQRSEADGVWRNHETTLGSELTLINARLGEIRQPTETE